MFKKLLIVGGGLALVSFLLFGAAAVGHVEQGVSWMRDKVQDGMPVEYELERARELIEKTGPQMRQCRRVIATKQVEIKYLKDELDQITAKHDRDREALRIQAAALTDSNRATFTVAGRDYSRTRFEQDAARRLDRVKATEQVLQSKKERLEAMQSALFAAETTLEKLRTQREQLVTQVATLEAKIQEVNAKKAMSLDIEVDDSHLAEAKDILARLNKKCDVDLQVMQNNQPLLGDLATEELEEGDLRDRIAAYFDAELPGDLDEGMQLAVSTGELEPIADR